MLRTSLRSGTNGIKQWLVILFLSSNAQDFIEDERMGRFERAAGLFLSSNAQDFIEERTTVRTSRACSNS